MAAKKKNKSAAKKTVKKTVKKTATKTAAKKTTGKMKMVAKKTTPMKTAAIKMAKTPSKPPTISAAKVATLFTPLDDRLLVQPEEAPTITAGGIYIPATVSGRPSRGTVLAKGRGRRNKKGKLRPLDVSVGDEVLFAEFSGSKINLGEAEILILREDDVLGIVNT